MSNRDESDAQEIARSSGCARRGAAVFDPMPGIALCFRARGAGAYLGQACFGLSERAGRAAKPDAEGRGGFRNQHQPALPSWKALAGWRMLAGLRARNLVRGRLRRPGRYAVSINLPFCVRRKRYSRPPCSMINSPRGPSSVWLEIFGRHGGRAVRATRPSCPSGMFVCGSIAKR